jgi:hypothetical protein
MQFGVIYLERCASTQPHIAFWTLEFHSCFIVFSRTCTVLLPATGQCLLCLVSSLVISLVGGAWASCLLTWVWGTHTISYCRFHTAVRLNSWCDNCESIEGRMTKQLGMANSRGWENSSIFHFQGCWLMEKCSSCDQISA